MASGIAGKNPTAKKLQDRKYGYLKKQQKNDTSSERRHTGKYRPADSGTQVSERFYRQGGNQCAHDSHSLIITGYLFTVAAQKGAGLCEEFISCRLGGKITNRIRHQMLEHFINLPMNKHDTFSSGEIMTRLDEDVEGVYEYYQILFLRIGTSVLLLVGVILSVAMKNRLTAILMLAVSLFSIWIYKVISDFGTKCYLKSSQAAAVFNGILKDKLDNLVEIHLAGAERHALVSLKKAMHEKIPGIPSRRPDVRQALEGIHSDGSDQRGRHPAHSLLVMGQRNDFPGYRLSVL